MAVLKATGDGLRTKEIAERMNIKFKTVEYYRAQLMEIFPRLDSSVKLARLAIAFGISTLCMMCMAAAAQPFLVVSNPTPQVQLAWNPSTPAPGMVISFYTIYWGVGSGQYTNAVNVGNVTNATVTLPARGVQFFFAVTATDPRALQSQFSNEVSYTAPSPPTPPAQKPLTVITVMKAPTPTGVFADTGMNWSDTPDQPSAYYKLKIDKGVMLSVAAPPVPK